MARSHYCACPLRREGWAWGLTQIPSEPPWLGRPTTTDGAFQGQDTSIPRVNVTTTLARVEGGSQEQSVIVDNRNSRYNRRGPRGLVVYAGVVSSVERWVNSTSGGERWDGSGIFFQIPSDFTSHLEIQPRDEELHNLNCPFFGLKHTVREVFQR